MLAKVTLFHDARLPGTGTKPIGISVSAVTANGITVVFLLPLGAQVSLSDEFEFDLERVDCEQDVPNLTKGTSHRVMVEKQNIHDARLQRGNGNARFPSVERRRGA